MGTFKNNTGDKVKKLGENRERRVSRVSLGGDFMAKEKKLTDRQRRFVQEYLIDFNASQSALRAGYTEKNHAIMGARQLQNPFVKEEIEKRMADIKQRNDLKQDEVVAEFKKIAFANITDFINIIPVEYEDKKGNKKIRYDFELKDLSQVAPEKLSAILEIKRNKHGDLVIKLHDKKGALDSLGRYLGMFSDNLSVNNKGDVAVKINVKGV